MKEGGKNNGNGGRAAHVNKHLGAEINRLGSEKWKSLVGVGWKVSMGSRKEVAAEMKGRETAEGF